MDHPRACVSPSVHQTGKQTELNPEPTSQPQQLFRLESIDEQTTKVLGRIILTPRLSTTWLYLMSALLAGVVVAFLFFGSYTRRSTVTGQLVPTAGMIRVNTPQAGVVLERRVAEGQFVHKGDVLYVLTSDRVGLAARELQADIGLQIGSRKRSMETEIGRNKAVEQQELGSLSRRLAALRSEALSIERQTEQQKQRVALAEDARKRYQGLADQDYIAREQYTQKEIDLSEQQSRLQQLQRDALANQREISATEREADNTRVRYANQNSLLQRSLSSADQELTEVEGRSRVIITAPESGQATLVAGEVGQAVDGTRPLLNLVPEDAQLEARLYAPSRTIGFVRAGDRVLLRYQSYPYQKFSQHEGVVFAISSAAVPNNELAGFALPELTPGEPVYAVTVRLKSQLIKAYGQDRRLQAGMRLDGDILQETRRLYEWMLEPLYSVTGRMEH